MRRFARNSTLIKSAYFTPNRPSSQCSLLAFALHSPLPAHSPTHRVPLRFCEIHPRLCELSQVRSSRVPIGATRLTLHPFCVAKRYTSDHEWISYDSETKMGTVSITKYAQESLGDVVFVELPKIGTVIEQGGMSRFSSTILLFSLRLTRNLRADRRGRIRKGRL